mgnify:CR=1 FL=1
MNLSRRGFFKAAGAAFATTMAFELSSQSEALAVEPAADWKLVNTEEYTNICCYCSGGCGVICSTREGELVNIEAIPTTRSTRAACARRAPRCSSCATWWIPPRAR